MYIADKLNARLLTTLSALALAGLLAASEPAQADTSVVSPSPASWDFGSDDIHSGGGPTHTFTFTNNTGGNVNVGTDAVVGPDASSFGLNADTCAGAFLPPTASCKVDVTFSATSAGPKTASLQLTDDTGTLEVPLSGTGVTGTLTASPTPLNFNSQPWYYGGQQQGLNLQNSNDAGTQVTSAIITGPDAARFYVANGQNCSTQQFGPGSACGMGIGFQPPDGPGTFHAQLEVASDSLASPLIVPLNAVALRGPHIALSPGDVSLGDVAVGQEASRTITVSNDGDSQLQVQQALIVTGTPQVFPVTADGCTGRVVDPGSSCQFTVHFQPKAAGTKEASVFLISNLPGPVTPIGISGTGVPSPAGTATITGSPAAGSTLTCHPAGYPADTRFAYQWLRNGRPLPGAIGQTLALTSGDVGASFACRLLATNPVGAQTVTTPPTAAVAPMDLSRQAGAFTDEGVCRNLHSTSTLRLRSRAVSVGSGNPATPWAPLTLTSNARLRVRIDGQTVGSGRTVIISPRALSAFADGAHTLQVNAGAHSARSQLLLAPCRLAARLDGGPGQTTTLSASARAGMNSLTFRLPRGLGLYLRAHRKLGSASLKPAGYPTRSFDLIGPRTTSNNVTVSMTTRTVRVTNLPVQVGVVRIALRPDVLGGRGGTVSLTAPLQGAKSPITASTPATWLP